MKEHPPAGEANENQAGPIKMTFPFTPYDHCQYYTATELKTIPRGSHFQLNSLCMDYLFNTCN